MTSLEPMMKLVQAKADVLILLGEAKERFYEAAAAAGVGDIRKVETMDEAVELAYKLSKYFGMTIEEVFIFEEAEK